MDFKSARAIEQIVWQLRLADYPRSLNRARIASLANGAPPYTEPEAAENGIEVNVNDLSLTRLSHDARLQLYAAFNKPGNFFTASLDRGSVEKRRKYSNIVTKEITKVMKRSDSYYQCMLSKFAMLVLHGIGPSQWANGDRWCPVALEIGDVMVPTKTLLTFENAPFFAIWKAFTPYELKKLTRNPERNPGWNMPVVDSVVEWADQETCRLNAGSTWSEYWVPEKRIERMREDSGIYSSDLVRTIDCWDFYFRCDEGWKRRIVLDSEGGKGGWTESGRLRRVSKKNLIGQEDLFIYNSGDRIVAPNINELVHFQFADLQSHAPFRYHGVRSLGFLLYAACHLQNRLRCAFSEAVFENMMMYMRVKSLDEAERVLKVELANRGFIDETVQFLSPAERWQPNAQLAELGLAEYKQIIADNSSSYVQNQNFSRDRTEKTKFQVMAEVNAMQTMVSAALQQAYRYQASEYREIFRRFMAQNSEDPEVRDLRSRCLEQGVPEEYLTSECWDIEPERVLGGGNKTMEMAISQQLMEWRAAFPAQSQQEILRDATLAITDDAARAERLVPYEPGVSSSKHDATVAFGSIMSGAVVEWQSSHNRLEVCETILTELELAVQNVVAAGGMASEDKVSGFQNVLLHVSELVAEIGADPASKPVAMDLAQRAGQVSNEVKGMAKRNQQQREAQAQAGGADGKLAETMAKIEADKAITESKIENSRQSHAQRTAQRQAQFELEQQQKSQQAALELQKEASKAQIELAKEQQKLAAQAVQPTLLPSE